MSDDDDRGFQRALTLVTFIFTSICAVVLLIALLAIQTHVNSGIVHRYLGGAFFLMAVIAALTGLELLRGHGGDS